MMQSEISCGLDVEGRPSSRVLKPPGGGHSNIFGAPDAEPPRARPKYNQQNSSNLNSCMNTVDPNEVVAKTRGGPEPSTPIDESTKPSQFNGATDQNVGNGFGGRSSHEPSQQQQNHNSGRGRVPPGGFSSGLW